MYGRYMGGRPVCACGSWAHSRVSHNPYYGCLTGGRPVGGGGGGCAGPEPGAGDSALGGGSPGGGGGDGAGGKPVGGSVTALTRVLVTPLAPLATPAGPLGTTLGALALATLALLLFAAPGAGLTPDPARAARASAIVRISYAPTGASDTPITPALCAADRGIGTAPA